MAFVQLAEGPLHYQLDGPEDAPVLVLSNSLGTDLHMWDVQIPAFTQHFRVLRFDTRGHGKSLVTEGPYSIEQLGLDVIALLDALDIQRAHFCGLSMGGLIGQWLGIAIYHSSVSGLGGCPYAKGATGNVATEDVLYMMQGLGIATGIDLDLVVDAGQFISQQLGRKGSSRAGNAIAAKRAG